ncbi:MAG: hypothetical protein RSC28_09180 [Bacteroidales bacterium]
MNPSDAIERKLEEIYDTIKHSSAANLNYRLLSGLGGNELANLTIPKKSLHN